MTESTAGPAVTDFGAFINLGPGVDGLIHVSEMSWSKKSVSPTMSFRSASQVEVVVLGVNPAVKRILSWSQAGAR